MGVRLVAVNRAYGERRVTMEEVTGVYPVMYRLVPARAREEAAAPAAATQSFTTAVVD